MTTNRYTTKLSISIFGILSLLSFSFVALGNKYNVDTSPFYIASSNTIIENISLSTNQSVESSIKKFEVEIDARETHLTNKKTINLPTDFDASTRKKIKTRIEKKLITEIKSLLNAKNLTLKSIEVIVDVNGLVALTKINGKNVPPDTVATIMKLVAKQNFIKLKIQYFWKYSIEFS